MGPGDKIVDQKREKQKDEIQIEDGSKNKKGRSHPMSDFQYALQDRTLVIDEMIKDMEQDHEGFKNEIDQFQDDIQALEKEKAKLGGGLNSIPGQKIENLMKKWGDEQNEYDDDYSLKQYARTLWISLHQFETDLKNEQSGHDLQIQYLHANYRNQISDLKHKTSTYIECIETALYETKTKYQREIERYRMTIEEMESKKMNQIKTKNHVNTFVNKIREEMVFRTVKEARLTIDQLCDNLESKQVEVDIKEGQLHVAKQMEIYYLDRQANDKASVESMHKTMRFYQSIIFKFVRDADLYADDKERWEKFTMIKEDHEKVEEQAKYVMDLKEIMLERRIIDYCNRYYGMEENVMKLDEALKQQGLLPEKLVTLDDLKKVKELEQVNKKRAAPKRAMTSAFLAKDIPVAATKPDEDVKSDEQQQDGLIDRSNEPQFSKAEKQILSGGFSKVINASVFNQKTVQREIQLIINSIKDGKLEEPVATAKSGLYKAVKKPDYEKHIKKKMKMIREREERKQNAEKTEKTAIEDKVKLEVAIEREKLAKKMAKLNAQAQGGRQSNNNLTRNHLQLPKHSSANVSRIVDRKLSSRGSPNPTLNSHQVDSIGKKTRFTGLKSALQTPGTSSMPSQSLASSGETRNNSIMAKKAQASKAFDGKTAVLIERTPEAEVNVVNVKNRFQNVLKDSSSSNSSKSESSSSQSKSQEDQESEEEEESVSEMAPTPQKKKQIYGTRTGAGKRKVQIRLDTIESEGPNVSKRDVTGLISSIQSVSSVSNSISQSSEEKSKKKKKKKVVKQVKKSFESVMRIESDDERSGMSSSIGIADIKKIQNDQAVSTSSANGSFRIEVKPKMPYMKKYDESKNSFHSSSDNSKNRDTAHLDLYKELKQVKKESNMKLLNLGQSQRVKTKKKIEKLSEKSDDVETVNIQEQIIDQIMTSKQMSQPVEIKKGEKQNKVSKVQQLILEMIKKIYPKLFKEDASKSKSDIKMNVKQIQLLQAVVQKCLGERLLFDDNQSLFVKDPLSFVEQANQIIIKYFNYAQCNQFVLNPTMSSDDEEDVAKKKRKRGSKKCPELGHILMPTISKDGLIMGFQIRYQMVQQAVEVMVYNDFDEDEIVTWVKRVLKAAIYFCRIMRDGLKQDYTLQEVKDGKIQVTTANFSQQVSSDDIDEVNMKPKITLNSDSESEGKDLAPDQVALNLLRSHAVVVAARVRPSKRAFYDMVWENHDFKKLLDQKLENVFYNSKELTIQSYFEALFKEIGNQIQKLDKDQIFKLDVGKLFEEKIVEVEVQGPPVMKRELSNKSIPEESSETVNRQAGSQSQLTSIEKTEVSEVDPTFLITPHDLVIEQNRYVGPLDTALYHEFLQTVKMFDKYADTVPKKKINTGKVKVKKISPNENQKSIDFNDDSAVGRLNNYSKFKPNVKLRETLQVLQKKLKDQAAQRAKDRLLEKSTEEALTTQQHEYTYSIDQTNLDVDISKSIGTPSNQKSYHIESYNRTNRNLRNFEDPRATFANIGNSYVGSPLNTSFQLDNNKNWQDNLKRQLYTSQDNQNYRNSARKLFDQQGVIHAPDLNMQFNADLNNTNPKQNIVKNPTHAVIEGLLKNQQSQIKNIQQNRPPNLQQNDILKYSTGFNSEEDLASTSLQNFSQTHDNILSKTINPGDQQEFRLLKQHQGQLRNLAPMITNLKKDPSHVLKRNRYLVSKTNTVTSKSKINYQMKDDKPQMKTIKSQIRGVQPQVIPHSMVKVPPACQLVQNAISRAGSSFNEDNDYQNSMSNPSMDLTSFRNQGIMSQALNQKPQNLLSLDLLIPNSSARKNQLNSPSTISGINLKDIDKKSPSQLYYDSTKYTQQSKKQFGPSDRSLPQFQTQMSQKQQINIPIQRMKSIDKDNIKSNYALISPKAGKQILSPQPSKQAMSTSIQLPENLLQKIHQPQFSFPHMVDAQSQLRKYKQSDIKLNKTKRRVVKSKIGFTGDEKIHNNQNNVQSYSTLNQEESAKPFVRNSIKMS